MKTHAQARYEDQTQPGNENPNKFIHVHRVHHHQEPIITEIHETHTNGFLLHHTSTIQY